MKCLVCCLLALVAGPAAGQAPSVQPATAPGAKPQHLTVVPGLEALRGDAPRLKATQVALQADGAVPDALEPDDTPAEATAIDYAVGVEGRIWQPGDEDYFRFTAAPGLVALRLEGAGAVGLTTVLWGPDGEVVAQGGSWLVVGLPAAGPYFLRVSGDEAASADPSGQAYRLTLEAFEVPDAVVGPGASIAAAIAAAVPGQRVLVLPGIYEEDVALAEGVSLIGSGTSTALVGQLSAEGLASGLVQGLRLGNPAGTGVLLGDTGVRLEHCLVTGSGGSGIFVFGTGGRPVLRHLWVVGNAANGVAAFDGGAVRLQDSAVEGNAEVGVWFVQQGGGEVVDSRIAANGFAGVQVQGAGSRGAVSGSQIVDNQSTGVFVTAGGQVEVVASRVAGNTFSGVTARQADSFAEVEGTVLEGNGNSGLWVVDGATARVAGGRVESNAFSGIAVQELGSRVEALGAAVATNGNSGLWATGGAEATVDGATVENNVLAGVAAEGVGSRIEVTGSLVSGNQDVGVSVRDSAAFGLVTGNRILDNASGGIWVLLGAVAEISDNEVAQSGGTAVAVALAGAQATIRQNRVFDNVTTGIGVILTGTATVQDNEVRGNAIHGILAGEGSQVQAVGNTSAGNGQMGIAFNEGGFGSAGDNDLDGNLSGAFVQNPAGPVVLEGNRLTGNTEQGIFVNEGGQVQIRANQIDSSGVNGIALQGEGVEAWVAGNTVGGSGRDGVSVALGAQVQLDSNTVEGSQKTGILIDEGGSSAALRGNLVVANGANGVFVDPDAEVTGLRDNEVTANGSSGIQVQGTAGDIQGNTVTANDEAGIWVRGGQAGDVLGNEIRDNQVMGLYVSEENACVGRIAGNVFAGNGTSGLRLSEGGCGGVVRDNVMRGNVGHGFLMRAGGRADSVVANRVEDNEDWGIFFEDSHSGPLWHNRVLGGGNGGTAVINPDSLVSLGRNYSAGSQGTGLFLQEARFVVETDTLSGHRLRGMQIEGGSGRIVASWVDGNAGGINVSAAQVELHRHTSTGNGNGLNAFEAAQVTVDSGLFEGDVVSLGDSATVGLLRHNRLPGGRVVVSDRAQGQVIGNDISGSGSWGVFVDGGAHAQVRDNRITGTELSGVRLQGEGTQGIIVGNRIEGNDEVGIWASQGADAEIRDNDISGNLEGVQYQSGASGEVVGNRIAANQRRGVLFFEGTEVRVEDNDITGNGNGGVQVEDAGTRGEVVGNRIIGNQVTGISLIEGATARIAGNRVEASETSGVLVDGAGSDGLLAANEIAANGRHGVLVSAGARARLDSNHIAANAQDGVQVAGAGSVLEGQGNSLRANLQSGLRVTAGGVSTTAADTIADNSWRGVHADGAGSRVDLDRAEVTGNARTGFWVTDGADGSLSGSRVAANGLSGAIFENGAQGQASGNLLVANAQVGLFVVGGAQVEVADNQIAGNDLQGLRLEGAGSGGLVTGNRIEGNADGGVFIFNVDGGAELAANDIVDNAGNGVDVSFSRGLVLRQSRIEGNEANGVLLRAASDFSLSENRIRANGRWGVGLQDTRLEAGGLAGNLLADNRWRGVGVEAGGGAPLVSGLPDEAVEVKEWTAFGLRQGVGPLDISGDLDALRLGRRRLLATAGFVWAATDGGVSRFEPQAGTWRTFVLGTGKAFGLTEAAEGTLWAATADGAYRWDGAAWQGPAAGLQGLEVYGVLQGREGLWAATADGAYRWDGAAWQGPTAGLRGPVHGLLERASGVLWAATPDGAWRWGGGNWEHLPPTAGEVGFGQLLETRDHELYGITAGTLQRLQEDAWTLVVSADSLGRAPVYAVFESAPDGAGPPSLWLGTAGGISRLDTASGLWLTYTTLVDPESGDAGPLSGVAFYQTPGGAVWAGTATGGAARFEPGRGRWSGFAVGDHPVLDLVETASGQLWAAAEGVGVSRLDAALWNGFTQASGVPDLAVGQLLQRASGRLWAATPGGAARFEEDRGVWQVFAAGLERFGPGSASVSVGALREDAAGQLWAATARGAARLDDATGAWTAFGQAAGVADTVKLLSPAPDGRLWAAADLGLSRFDGGLWTTFAYAGRDSTRPTALLATAARVWVGHEEGLARYDLDEGGWSRALPPEPLQGAAVRALAVDEGGRVWVGTERGLGRFEPVAGAWTVYGKADGLPDDDVGDVLLEGDTVWVATDRGVGRLDGTGQWTGYGAEAGLGSSLVTVLRQASDGAVWAGTKGGVSRFDAELGRWVTFTREDGLLDNEVNDLWQDAAGRLWIATEGGVSRLIGADSPPPVFALTSGDVEDGFAAAPFAAFEAQVTDPKTLEKRLVFTHALVPPGSAPPPPDWAAAVDQPRVVLSDLADGSYRLFVWARDRLGKTARQSQDFTVDTAPPIALLTRPRANEVVTGVVEVRGTVIDRSGVPPGSRPDLVEWRLDLRAAAAEDWQELVQVTDPAGVVEGVLGPWDSAALSGAYELRLQARDRLGHIGEAVVPVEVVAARRQVQQDRQGRLADVGGQVALLLPPGALATDTLVTVTRLAGEERSQALAKAVQTRPLSELYRIQPADLALAKPAVLQIAVDGDTTQPAAVHRLDGGAWVPVGGHRVEVDGRPVVRTGIERLGVFALFEAGPAAEGGAALSALACQPRMISPRGGGFAAEMQISFKLGRGDQVRVAVFDAAGHRVRLLADDTALLPGSNVVTWDGRDGDGRWVREGAYIVRVESGGATAKKIVAVVNGQAIGGGDGL